LTPRFQIGEGRLAEGANIAVLDSDVESDSASVNEALRALAQIIQACSGKRSPMHVKYT